MPRRNSPRRRGAKARPEPEQDLAARALGAQRVESAQDGDWAVRAISAGAAVKSYRCPGCAQEIPPGTPHTVTWRADGRGDDRRHWHTTCWNNRARRWARLPRR